MATLIVYFYVLQYSLLLFSLRFAVCLDWPMCTTHIDTSVRVYVCVLVHVYACQCLYIFAAFTHSHIRSLPLFPLSAVYSRLLFQTLLYLWCCSVIHNEKRQTTDSQTLNRETIIKNGNSNTCIL